MDAMACVCGSVCYLQDIKLSVLYLQEFYWIGRLRCSVSHALDSGSCFGLFILAVPHWYELKNQIELLSRITGVSVSLKSFLFAV